MKAVIYHNPNCSKSRQALALLEEKDADIKIIDYLKHPPTQQEIKDVLEMLDLPARELIRRKETLYKELKLEKATGAQLIKAMVKHPSLIERPIVISNGKAAIGRPPENILNIIK